MNIIEKMKNLVTHPRKFMCIVVNEPLTKTLEFFIFLALLNFLFHVATITLFFPMEFLMEWTSSLVMILINAVFVHIFLQLMKVTDIHSFERTLKILIYASTPFVFLGWLPIVGILGTVGLIFLLMSGIKDVYKISWAKAIIAAFAPYIIGIILTLFSQL